MNLREKIKSINKNLFLEKSKEEEKDEKFDVIESCSVNATIKCAAFDNESYFKINESYNQEGLINVDHILNEKIEHGSMRELVFCDKKQVIYLSNIGNGGRYVEDYHESFITVYDHLYIVCDNKESYNSFKNYVKQSSIWHKYFKSSDEVPNIGIYEKLFNDKEKKIESPNISQNQQVKAKNNENTIELDGIISSVSKTFMKKDNKPSKFITVTQEDFYNGKKSDYTISVSLEDEILKKYEDKLSVGDKVKISGKLVNYLDKNKNLKFIKVFEEEFEDPNEAFQEFLLSLIPKNILVKIILKGNNYFYDNIDRYL